MNKKLIALITGLIIISTGSTSVFAKTIEGTSNTTQQQIKQNQNNQSDVDAKLKELFNGRKSIQISFTTKAKSKDIKTIQSRKTYNQKWNLTLYRDDTIVCRNVTKGITYRCNMNNSCVGYGYTTSGDSVGCIQGLLDKLGARLDGDGVFGSSTYKAIVAFQRRYSHQLSVDGVAGPKTFKWAAFIVFGDEQNI